MPLRETLLNLAITAVLVLIVVLVGIVVKEGRPGPMAAVPVKVAGIPGLTVADEGGVPRVATVEFEIFVRTQLIESRANEADTLRIRVGDDEHIFVLYFVDALDASMNHPQRVAEQGRWFGKAADRTIIETGVEAAAFVAELLKNRRFKVITRWEHVPNTVRYYALILVELQPERYVYLADLLMQKGYARVQGVTTELPADKRDMPSYLAELQGLGRQAREARAGIWAKVAK